MLKAILWFVIFAALAGGSAYYYYSSQHTATEEPQPVQRQEIHRNAHGTGLIEGNGVPVRLRSPFAALLDDLDAKEGQTVKLNDIVARLNPAEIDNKIKLGELTLKEAEARRDALSKRKSVELIEKAEAEIKREQAGANELEDRLLKLKTPLTAALRQDRIEDAGRAVERAKRMLALAEAELAQLKSHPTPDESAVAKARLDAAQLRTGNDAAAAELRLALAEFDKIKHGANEKDLAAAEARLALAKSEFEAAEAEKSRLENPPSPPPVPMKEIVELERSLGDARARVAARRDALEKLRHDAEEAELRAANAGVERETEALKALKQMKLGYELRAPFDALVLKRHVEPGALLAPFEDILTVVDFTRKRVRAEFDVMQLPSLSKPNLTASIKSRAFGREELQARVVDIGKVGTRKLLLDDPSQPKGGEVAEVLLEIDPPPADKKESAATYALLRPGLRVEADIVLESRLNAVSVPNSYIASENGPNGTVRQFVYKVETNPKTGKFEKSRKQEVKCGLRDDYYVEILEGLNVDDLVIKPKARSK